MHIFTLDKEIFLNFIEIYMIILAGLSAITMFFLLFVKIQRRKYISFAKKELGKIKGKEYTIFYKVEDFIENSIYDFGKCVLIIKGFDVVCDTLRKHWNYDDKLKLIYTIKCEYTIDVEIFFDNSGSWKKIEGLYNLSDGVNYVNQYEIIVKENEKVRSILQMLFITSIAMWVGIIPMVMVSLFTGQFTGILKLNSEMLSEIIAPIMVLPLFFQTIMCFISVILKRDDKYLPILQIIQIFIMAMPAYSILISVVYWYILLDI